ncbi:MAG: endo-1,4-beta-xylanase [Cytophagales bacterium]|nr:endo-1,4-beta-xylanase [Cytophagales bacterium]
MRKSLLLLFLCTMLSTFLAQGQNLIGNGSFENDFAGWTNLAEGGSTAAFSVTGDAVDGTKALKADITTPGANPWDVQTIGGAWASEAGKSYTLTFYAKGSVAGSVLRAVQQQSTYAQQVITLTTAWQKYEWTFTAGEAGLQLKFHFPEAGTFYIDNIGIPAPAAPPVSAPNLLPNGGFESDLANWFTQASSPAAATFSVVTGDAPQGNKALKVDVVTAGPNPWSVQAINDNWLAETGKTYTLTFYAKAAAAGSTFKVIQQNQTYAEKIFTLTTAWQKYDWTFTAQEASLQLKFHFPNAGIFFIDNLVIPKPATPNDPVIVQAESGTLGAQPEPPVLLTAQEGGVGFVRVQGDFASTTNPGTASRVVTYTVTFPFAGTYSLYARVRVGSGGGTDDSFYYANGFGAKSATSDNDWITNNNLFGAGYTAAADVVAGQGTAGTLVWKWVKLSDYTGAETPIKFTVPEGSLTQTFQVGSRENGIDFDQFAFGRDGVFFTVANLDNGQAGSVTPPPPPCTPPTFPLPALALGKPKFLGGVYSQSQLANFTSYFNQVVPENAGKWGSVEAARDVMNWTELDAAYQLAEDNGFPFRFHVLIWGNQQPAWIENLPPAEQLEEIREWYAAVAARYPGIDFLEVVNEPTNDPPNQPGNGGGNYINALGGSGATGWDWVLTSFRLARQYFPAAKLMINDYNVESTPANVQRYLGIINLLKAENLVDAIGLQGHAFSTRFASAATLKSVLDGYQATGLPVYVTELDIDGQTDQIQLDEYKRVFPVYWEHPAVAGVTLWGYRPGHWRTAQGAFLATAEGCERPALVWLRRYVGNNPPVAALAAAPTGGFAPLPVSFDGSASADADNEPLTYEWNFGNGTTATGKTAAYTYTLPGTYTATLTVKDTYGAVGTATATVTVAPGLKVQYRVRPDGHRTNDNRIKPHFQLVNVGDKAVPYSQLKIRYWYTRENASYPWATDNTGQQFWVDYAALGNGQVQGKFTALPGPRAGADHYLEVSFAATTSLLPGGRSGEIQTRFNNANWSDFNEANDYSFDPSKTDYTDWNRVTLYRNGELIWGTEPAAVAASSTARAASPAGPGSEAALKVYPNPSREGRFRVEVGADEAAGKPVLQILNAEGKEVVRQPLEQAVYTQGHPLKPGMYLIRVHGPNGVMTKKLMVQ